MSTPHIIFCARTASVDDLCAKLAGLAAECLFVTGFFCLLVATNISTISSIVIVEVRSALNLTIGTRTSSIDNQCTRGRIVTGFVCPIVTTSISTIARTVVR